MIVEPCLRVGKGGLGGLPGIRLISSMVFVVWFVVENESSSFG